jgi:CheY-like chemotaxis protein
VSSGPILIVEDERDVREMLAASLELFGHAVITATDGAQAFNMARAHHPCLILLDLMMPVMSGQEFRQAQLANDDIRGIPVVVMSAHHEARKIARQMNAAGCIPKPVDFDALEKLVAQRCR